MSSVYQNKRIQVEHLQSAYLILTLVQHSYGKFKEHSNQSQSLQLLIIMGCPEVPFK